MRDHPKLRAFDLADSLASFLYIAIQLAFRASELLLV